VYCENVQIDGIAKNGQLNGYCIVTIDDDKNKESLFSNTYFYKKYNLMSPLPRQKINITYEGIFEDGVMISGKVIFFKWNNELGENRGRLSNEFIFRASNIGVIGKMKKKKELLQLREKYIKRSYKTDFKIDLFEIENMPDPDYDDQQYETDQKLRKEFFEKLEEEIFPSLENDDDKQEIIDSINKHFPVKPYEEYRIPKSIPVEKGEFWFKLPPLEFDLTNRKAYSCVDENALNMELIE
jgi:hypothetical protein